MIWFKICHLAYVFHIIHLFFCSSFSLPPYFWIHCIFLRIPFVSTISLQWFYFLEFALRSIIFTLSVYLQTILNHFWYSVRILQQCGSTLLTLYIHYAGVVIYLYQLCNIIIIFFYYYLLSSIILKTLKEKNIFYTYPHVYHFGYSLFFCIDLNFHLGLFPVCLKNYL